MEKLVFPFLFITIFIFLIIFTIVIVFYFFHYNYCCKNVFLRKKKSFFGHKKTPRDYGNVNTFMEAICHAEKTMQNQMKKHVFKNCCSTSYSETLLTFIFHFIPCL